MSVGTELRAAEAGDSAAAHRPQAPLTGAALASAPAECAAVSSNTTAEPRTGRHSSTQPASIPVSRRVYQNHQPFCPGGNLPSCIGQCSRRGFSFPVHTASANSIHHDLTGHLTQQHRVQQDVPQASRSPSW